jgi:ABC-type branched-subunit amino acid transport system permease subunit
MKTPTQTRTARLVWAGILAVLVIAPFIGLYPVFMMKALCFAIFACAFNLLLGFTGLLSFGHACFLGSAAYITGWVVLASLTVCLGTWVLIEKTKLGATLRAGTENPALVQAFGINVPMMVMLTYGAGAGLAAMAGVLAAPVIQITPLMGSNLIIVVFAVVVIGGMGSILGSILTGLMLGIVEGLTKVFYPEASSIVVFVIMAIVLMIRPAGLFGKEK